MSKNPVSLQVSPSMKSVDENSLQSVTFTAHSYSEKIVGSASLSFQIDAHGLVATMSDYDNCGPFTHKDVMTCLMLSIKHWCVRNNIAVVTYVAQRHDEAILESCGFTHPDEITFRCDIAAE